MSDAKLLYTKSSNQYNEARSLLAEARVIGERTGLSVDSSILDASYQSPFFSPHFAVLGMNGDGNINVNVNANVNTTKKNSLLHSKESLDGDSARIITNSTSTSTNISTAAASETIQNSTIQNSSRKNALQAFPPILSTTGGHSNTDHVIQITGNHRSDTIAEYKRKLKRRARAMQPEHRGSDRWDQPRVAGSRRRRIAREKDLPSAPPEPPPSGYVLFIAQMTTKIRHDRPNAHHNQIKVVREISKIWKFGMSHEDREYYNEFAREAREEYERQHFEFRATGAYKPSRTFERLGGGEDHGPWVRIATHEKNALEREISNYDTVKFPPRPETADKPEWVTKIEKQNEREAKRKEEREKRLKQQREEEILLLKEASEAKMKRLQQANEYKHM